ncbi:MAG: DUF72 domain-containing protein [Candidatus Theseobacter exili]|nr:DUF72 domain-containing protein [Candidatus Theseobacter exili]
MSEFRLGTSGYSYRHWSNDVFYPSGLSQKKWLEYYATQFDSVELNVTFYRLPSKKTFNGWHRATPDFFTFVIKGSRYITHIKRLKDCEDSLNKIAECADALEEKLTAVLWQLPPSMRADIDRLNIFCDLLEKHSFFSRIEHAFEFRHESWFSEAIITLLQDRTYVLCAAHSGVFPWRDEVTSDYCYYRFHGENSLYGSDYSDGELEWFAASIRDHLDAGRDVYAFFNNDTNGFAVNNARKLSAQVIKEAT